MKDEREDTNVRNIHFANINTSWRFLTTSNVKSWPKMDLTGPSKSSQIYTSMVLVQSVCLHYSPPTPPNLHGKPLGHCSACCIACFASESTLATSALMDFSFSSASSWHAELVVEGSRSNKWLGKDWRKSEGCHLRSDDVCEHAKCPTHLSITLWRLNPSNLLPERWKCTHPRKNKTRNPKMG